MRRHIGIVLVGLALMAILVLYFVSFTVRWKEQALVLTFGKISEVETEPGLKWTWPWQSVVKFDGRVRTYQQKAIQTSTKDKQTIIASVYVNWRILDARSFYERFRKSGVVDEADIVVEAEKTLNSWVSESVNMFAEYNLGQLVTLDEASFQLVSVERGADGKGGGMLGRIRDKAAAGGGYGIEIIDLGIRQLGVPDSVTQAVFNRMREERGAVERTLLAEGSSEATSIVGKAEAEAKKIRAEAESKARAIEGQGDAEAAQYYSYFLAHPELANFLRKLKTLRETLSERTTIVLDSDTPPYSLLNNGPDFFEESSGQSISSSSEK